MDSIPRLETPRLRLRAVFPNDAPAILELFSDAQVARFYEFESFTHLQQSQELISQFTAWFQNDEAVRWAITLKETGELIGTCCFDTFQKNYQSVNLGYNVRSDQWGHGFASEAVRAIIDFGFEHGVIAPINRIQAITVPVNVGSERVLKKLGFQHEGLMRQYGFWKGEFHDMNRFSLIRADRLNGFPTP